MSPRCRCKCTQQDKHRHRCLLALVLLYAPDCEGPVNMWYFLRSRIVCYQSFAQSFRTPVKYCRTSLRLSRGRLQRLYAAASLLVRAFRSPPAVQGSGGHASSVVRTLRATAAASADHRTSDRHLYNLYCSRSMLLSSRSGSKTT